MFSLEDREICKNCVYKEICGGECEKTIKGYKEIEEFHRKENGKLRERVKELEELNKQLEEDLQDEIKVNSNRFIICQCKSCLQELLEGRKI